MLYAAEQVAHSESVKDSASLQGVHPSKFGSNDGGGETVAVWVRFVEWTALAEARDGPLVASVVLAVTEVKVKTIAVAGSSSRSSRVSFTATLSARVSDRRRIRLATASPRDDERDDDGGEAGEADD